MVLLTFHVHDTALFLDFHLERINVRVQDKKIFTQTKGHMQVRVYLHSLTLKIVDNRLSDLLEISKERCSLHSCILPNIIENNIMEFEAKCFLLKYTGSFAPADFSGAAFTCAHFQNIAKISSLCEFDYISEGIPSLMRFWLVMTQVLRIWFIRNFARYKKMDKPRTRCTQDQLYPHLSGTPNTLFTTKLNGRQQSKTANVICRTGKIKFLIQF